MIQTAYSHQERLQFQDHQSAIQTTRQARNPALSSSFKTSLVRFKPARTSSLMRRLTSSKTYLVRFKHWSTPSPRTPSGCSKTFTVRFKQTGRVARSRAAFGSKTFWAIQTCGCSKRNQRTVFKDLYGAVQIIRIAIQKCDKQGFQDLHSAIQMNHELSLITSASRSLSSNTSMVQFKLA